MKVRGILPTNRPDDIPLADWQRIYYGKLEAFDRAMARLWIAMLVRPWRSLGQWGRRKKETPGG